MASGAIEAVRGHWPEYLIEAAGLALFMISAGAFATLLEYPQSPVRGMLPDPLVRRALMGIAMGATAIGLIYSPWGRQSGAHFNPAVTLAFSRLGKVAPWDGVFYVIAQFVGGLAGVLAVSGVLGNAFRGPPVEFVVTVPGSGGPLIAFLAEFAISCGLMLAVLYTSNRVRLMRYTGLFAGALLAAYITVEALRATSGPGIELLEYRFPQNGRPISPDERATHLVHREIVLKTANANRASEELQRHHAHFVSPDLITFKDAELGFHEGLVVRDPDGHALRIVAP